VIQIIREIRTQKITASAMLYGTKNARTEIDECTCPNFKKVVKTDLVTVTEIMGSG
jgi:hypothetical protein